MQRQAEIDSLERGRNLRPKPVRENEYIVGKILDTRIQNHRRQYKVLWSGYEVPTWEDESYLAGARDLVNKFLKGKRLVYVLI